MADLLASSAFGVSPTSTTISAADNLGYESGSLATHHLCVGVHIDRIFRDQVIRRIHNDPHHRIAPSYGFDLVPIVRHAWQSWLLEFGLLASVVGTLFSGVALGHRLAVFIVVCGIAICVMLRRTGCMLLDAVRLKTTTLVARLGWRGAGRVGPAAATILLAQRKRQLIVAVGGCAIVMVAPLLVARLTTAQLSDEARPAGYMTAVLFGCAALVGALRHRRLIAAQFSVPHRPRSLTRREQMIDKQQTHACVIYRRPVTDEYGEAHGPDDSADIIRSPFMGSGRLVNRWLPPMTVPLLKEKSEDKTQVEYSTPPFLAHELVERLRSALQLLTTDQGPDRLPGLRVRDRLFVANSDVATDRGLLRADLDTLQLWRVIDNHQLAADHFLEASAPIAQGEVVVTILTRISVKGRCLSLDVATTALTRTPTVYQTYGRRGAAATVRAAVHSVLTLPVDVLELRYMLSAPLTLLQAWWVGRNQSLALSRRKELGPELAIREERAAVWRNAQLDRTVIYDHMKIVEQRILKTTKDFLTDHNVDTSAFETRATNIINSGVLNMGGVMDIDQSAIGTNAEFNQATGGEGQQA